MMKAYVNFLLSLCILLSSGYSPLYAHQNEESSNFSAINGLIEANNELSADAIFSQKTHIHTSPQEQDKKIEIGYWEIEEQENETNFSKKYLECSKYLSTIYYALASGHLFQEVKIGLNYYKHFYHISSFRKHLFIQVFLI